MDLLRKEMNEKINKYISDDVGAVYEEMLKKDELELEEIVIICTLDEILAKKQKICEYIEDGDDQLDSILEDRRFLIEYGIFQDYKMNDEKYKEIVFFEMLLNRAEKIHQAAADDLRFEIAADIRETILEIKNKTPRKFEHRHSDREDQISNSYTVKKLRRMDASKFEEVVSNLWEINGWETKLTPSSSDKGIDVIATKEEMFDKRRHLIQAKRYNKNNKVGSKEVQKYAGLYQRNEQVDKVFIITTSYFTKDAKEVASNRGVQLLNGEKIKNMLNENFD